MSRIDNIIEGLQSMRITTWDYDNLAAVLYDLCPEIKQTKTLMKTLIDKLSIFQCCCCVQVFDTLPELERHIKLKRHKLGQKRLASDKRDLLHKVCKALPEENLCPSLLPEGTMQLLTQAEKAAYTRIFHKNEFELTPAEEATYHNILTLELHLHRLKYHKK